MSDAEVLLDLDDIPLLRYFREEFRGGWEIDRALWFIQEKAIEREFSGAIARLGEGTGRLMKDYWGMDELVRDAFWYRQTLVPNWTSNRDQPDETNPQ